MTGRAVVFHGPGRPLELVRAAVGEPRAGELLVRVLTCSLCRSDLHSHAGRRSVATPTILGHEIVGRIEAFGPGTAYVDLAGHAAATGDRITWSIVVGCGACFFCRRDLPQKCERLFKYGHEAMAPDRGWEGGLADFAVLRPGTAWLRLPEGIPDAVASLANCSAATTAAVLRAAGPVADQRVLVLGAGVLGVMACAMARSMGALQVIAVDPQPACRERALAFGATQTFDPADKGLNVGVLRATDGVGADVALELSGSTISAATGLALVCTGGTVVLAGAVAASEPLAVDPEAIVRRMITLRGVHNYHPRDLQAAVAFLAGPGAAFPFASLVAEQAPLERAEEAFARAHASPGLRVVVAPSLV